jgi:5-methylcytosine-specific restriction enzyme subunit McrC
MAETAQRIEISEYESLEVRLADDLARRISHDGHVSMKSIAPGLWEIKAKHNVGVLRYDDVEIRIVPKVAVGRLLHLSTYHDDPATWRNDVVELSTIDDPESAIGFAFAAHAERAVRPAPLQGYQTHETAEWNLRGRLLFDRQISRQAGLVLPAELRYDEFEIDITENQILKAAIAKLEPSIRDSGLRSRLAHLRFQLDGVAAWRSGQRLPAINWTRLNERYRPAIGLARLILEGRSLEMHGTSSSAASAFLFNMNTVFESFLSARLTTELEARYGRVVLQHDTYLDLGEGLRMKPDITWWQGPRCLAVIDAKYKRVHNDNYPNADAYQMLAYCTRLGLPEGWLVYADLDGGEPANHLIEQAGVTIRSVDIDLAGSIEDLNASVRSVSDAIAHSAQRSSL